MESIQQNKSLVDPKVEAWWNDVKKGMEKISENPPDPKIDPLQYQALLGGYKSAAEFKKDYLKRSILAVGAGGAAGAGLFATGLALSAGAIVGGSEISSLGIASWNAGRLAWSSAMTMLATPKAQDLLAEVVECTSGYFDSSSIPESFRGQYWSLALQFSEHIDGMQQKHSH